MKKSLVWPACLVFVAGISIGSYGQLIKPAEAAVGWCYGSTVILSADRTFVGTANVAPLVCGTFNGYPICQTMKRQPCP